MLSAVAADRGAFDGEDVPAFVEQEGVEVGVDPVPRFCPLQVDRQFLASFDRDPEALVFPACGVEVHAVFGVQALRFGHAFTRFGRFYFFREADERRWTFGGAEFRRFPGGDVVPPSSIRLSLPAAEK